MKSKENLEQLREIAKFSNLGLTFKKEGRKWFAFWSHNGRQVMCGTLAEARRLAAGKSSHPKTRKVKAKYKVIGSASQWAITDFQLSIKEAKRVLSPTAFSTGAPALAWMWGFSSRKAAEDFVERCNARLAFECGKIKKWAAPTFAVVDSRD